MPTLSKHKSEEYQRILLVGDPGGGKTTAVGHLLEHGQRLFFLDFDDGLDPIRHFIDPKYHDNLIYETLVDKVKIDPTTGYPSTVGKPTAYRRFVKLMDNWVDSVSGEDYGKPESWGKDTWLVVDNITSLGQAALMYTLDFNRRMGQMVRKKDWGDAIRRVEGVPQLLRSMPINVVVLSHLLRLTVESDEDEDERPKKKDQRSLPQVAPENLYMRYPSALGQKLPPRFGGYFNVILQAKRVGHGANAKRVIKTVPDQDVDIKFPVPAGKLPIEVDISRLYDIVQELRRA